MYDRKIIYLHRYEGEMDKGNVGYIKQEKRNDTCSFMVTLMNLPPDYRADTALCVLPVGHTLCKVHIKDGKGQGMAICEEKQLLDMGLFYDQINKFEINVNETITIRGEQAPLKKPREEVAPIDSTTVPDVSDMPVDNLKKEAVEAASIREEAVFAGPREIYKNKWEQLSSGRKRVNLMGKESDYIQITPKDMIALSNPYHSLVNNAFLLHGYYNYNHLILGPAKGNKSTYFIGVPGNFYKQEVNAARMFGFEYFENGGDKVEVGDFGYYMKKVKL